MQGVSPRGAGCGGGGGHLTLDVREGNGAISLGTFSMETVEHFRPQ